MAEEDYSDEELEALRRRRLAEMQRAAVDDQRRTEAQQQVERQKQAIIRRILTPEARQRLTNIRMVKPRRKSRKLSKRTTITFWKNQNKLGRSSLRSKRSRKKSLRRKRKKSRPKKLLKVQQRQRKQKKRSWKSLKRNSMILTFAEYGMLLARSGPQERSGSSESSYLSE